jgi:hypothetical protein
MPATCRSTLFIAPWAVDAVSVPLSPAFSPKLRDALAHQQAVSPAGREVPSADQLDLGRHRGLGNRFDGFDLHRQVALARVEQRRQIQPAHHRGDPLVRADRFRQRRGLGQQVGFRSASAC